MMKHTHFVLITAVTASVVAALMYRLMIGQAISEDPVISLPGTALATLLVAALFWWLFVSRPARPTLLRGGLTGLLISVLSFPAAIFVTILISLARNGPSEAGIVEDLLLAPLFSLGFSILALATVGIFAVPAGIVSGAALAFLQSKVARER